MGIRVEVEPPFSRRVVRRNLARVASQSLTSEGRGKDLNLSIVVVGDQTMRRFNRRFHKVNSTTDVLSFPSDEPDNTGDILISYETALRNARKVGWRVRDELELLVVHGVLHLLGYDDVDASSRARMWQRQAEILGRSIRT